MPRTRPGMLSPAFYIRWQSLNRGLLGEDRFWRLVYGLLAGRRAARRLLGPRHVWRLLYPAVYGFRLARMVLRVGPQLVSLEKLQPGQFVRVEAIDPRTLTPAERKLYKR
jgi:hypothetical protein